ncbi:MAG: ABC transporter ATP-binding protein [Planctomycetes bacterium]|nr:ABC transporter ATP-binding protein [Planctomycetota bacterium]
MQEAVMADEANTVIELTGVSKVFGSYLRKVNALSDIDLVIKKGRVCALLGPNGAGKTTMIKIILGLLKPSSGKMNILGEKEMTKNLKENLGFLPEESYLYPFLTIQETLEFAAGLYKNKQDNLQRIDSVLDLVGLKQFKTRKISQCSKGMARRTAFAQAIIHDPDLIILDEPTSGYDPIGTAEVKRIIKQLRDQGKTVILCSHQLADVEEVCDDVVILYGGQIISRGEMNELLKEERQIGYSVDSKHANALNAWLAEQEIDCREIPVSQLEKYFIHQIGKCTQEQLLS